MIKRLVGLFKRYVHRHGYKEYLGFQLIDSSGHRFGHIDKISIREGRMWVDGWALSTQVGIANNEQATNCVPNLAREDVLRALGEINVKKPGFVLEIPFSQNYTVFWADVMGTRYMHPLPQFTMDDMHRAQIVPFVRDLTKAIPAGLHWLAYRDAKSKSKIKFLLRLNTVSKAGSLNSLIFSKSSIENNDPTPNFDKLSATIVLPIYNAFELLPEVLDRVLKHTDIEWRLIIVEDCSTDLNVRPWLLQWQKDLNAETSSRISMIFNEKNLGFINSVNRAFREAIPYGNHVILLNSDAFVPARWASRLINPLTKYNNVASVTPMSNDAEIFNIPAICKREQLNPGEADAIDKVANNFFPGADIGDAPTGVGFCMAMNIEFLQKFPQLDTVFGRGYGEEVDWCQRTRQKGGRHLGLGSLFVEHRGGTSFGSAEKIKLIQKNSQVITQRYPLYDADVQDFIRVDPLNTSRLALGIAWAGIRQNGAVPVYLAHNLGGGAEHYLQSRIKYDLEVGAAAIVLRVGGLSRWQIELHNIHGITRGETDSTELVVDLLKNLSNRKIIYSCAVGDSDPLALPEILISLAGSPEDEIEVLIHDFFPLSPSYTLLGSDGSYRDLPIIIMNTDEAHSICRPNGTLADLKEWRSAWGKLFDKADSVVVFSENSRSIVQHAYPDIENKLVVIPHKSVKQFPPLQIAHLKEHKPIVGVLGNIGYQKGASVLRDLSQRFAKSGRARLVIIGNVDPAYQLASSAHIHGDYRVDDIPSLIMRYGIDRWLIPSIWPETFSYTTHEALATGLPVFSFNLGAQGDAVALAAKAHGRGGTISLNNGKADISKLVESLINS